MRKTTEGSGYCASSSCAGGMICGSVCCSASLRMLSNAKYGRLIWFSIHLWLCRFLICDHRQSRYCRRKCQLCSPAVRIDFLKRSFSEAMLKLFVFLGPHPHWTRGEHTAWCVQCEQCCCYNGIFASEFALLLASHPVRMGPCGFAPLCIPISRRQLARQNPFRRQGQMNKTLSRSLSQHVDKNTSLEWAKGIRTSSCGWCSSVDQTRRIGTCIFCLLLQHERNLCTIQLHLNILSPISRNMCELLSVLFHVLDVIFNCLKQTIKLHFFLLVQFSPDPRKRRQYRVHVPVRSNLKISASCIWKLRFHNALLAQINTHVQCLLDELSRTLEIYLWYVVLQSHLNKVVEHGEQWGSHNYVAVN